MRAAIYTRVSSEEQLEGYSLEAQEEVNRQLCEQRGWQVVHLYEERGRSGKNALRPEFQAMIRDAEAELFDVVVVHKLDRFSRSLLDMLMYLNKLHEYGASLTSATEQFDFSTPIGKMVLAMLGAFAQWYVDNLAQEVRKGKKQRAKSGGWNGTLSFGYITPRRLRTDLTALGEAFKAGMMPEDEYSRKAGLLEDELEKYGFLHETHAVPCPINAPAVLLAYELYATGHFSDTDVAWKLNERGYRTSGNWGENPFTKDTVTWMLQNRFYLGETSYQGKEQGAERKWMPGEQEPLINQELFDRCQTVRKMRTFERNTSRSRDVAHYPLSPLLVCLECGSKWRGQNLRGQRRYRDPARQLGKKCGQYPKSKPAEMLEEQIEVIIRDMRLRVPDDWQQRVLKQLKVEEPDRYEEVERLRKMLEARLERARRLFVMGDISETKYVQIRQDVKGQMPDEPVASMSTMLDLEHAATLLADTESVWSEASQPERKMLLQALFETLYVNDGEIVAVEPTKVMWTLQNCATMVKNGTPEKTNSVTPREIDQCPLPHHAAAIYEVGRPVE